jgi:radical SAM protein with 4Fe4S-binding SPASM domain
MGRVYDLSRELGVEFTCAVAHVSEHYFQTAGGGFAIPPSALRQQADQIIGREMRGFSAKRWARAYFLDGMVRFSMALGRPLPCRAGEDMFFLSPEGDVYPCNAFSAKMGNIEETDFAVLWDSPEAKETRRRLAGCHDGCWMVCSARTAMRRHWPTVLTWCLARKVGMKRE